MNHYCLVSFSRTGSTALEKALNSHDSIHHDFTRLPTVQNKKKWVNDFLDRKDANIDWMGFKCLLYQFDDNIEDSILRNKKFTKIILLRHDIFQAAISKKVAERINNWHVCVNYDIIDPFTIDLKWFSNYIKLIKDISNRWVSVSNNYKVFYYEDIFYQEDLYDSVLQFLGVDETVKRYEICKVNDYDKIKDIIINFKEIRNEYEQIIRNF